MTTATTATETDNGYRGPGLAVLRKHGVSVWSDVVATTTTGKFRGIILPRSETADDRHIVLKMNTGYNVGLAADTIRDIEQHGARSPTTRSRRRSSRSIPAKPNGSCSSARAGPSQADSTTAPGP
jgi:glutamyl-tRNA(Gln) amidotransferase subunit D